MSRKPENGWMSKHFQFESNFSLSGANADYRARIKPSEELAVAEALLNELARIVLVVFFHRYKREIIGGC